MSPGMVCNLLAVLSFCEADGEVSGSEIDYELSIDGTAAMFSWYNSCAGRGFFEATTGAGTGFRRLVPTPDRWQDGELDASVVLRQAGGPPSNPSYIATIIVTNSDIYTYVPHSPVSTPSTAEDAYVWIAITFFGDSTWGDPHDSYPAPFCNQCGSHAGDAALTMTWYALCPPVGG
jgi:hypothetical protein